jgi:hypothetical protein
LSEFELEITVEKLTLCSSINQNQINLMKTFTKITSLVAIVVTLCCFRATAQVDVDLTITAGNFPEEIGWVLLDELGNTLGSGSIPDGAPFSGTFTFPAGTCSGSIQMTDDFGDGWNGGTYTLTYNSIDFAVGTLAGAAGTDTFTLPVCGCTDSGACNFSADAVIDNGTCCTDNCITVSMMDDFGNGWNGATYTIATYPGGIEVASGTLTFGSAGADVLCMADGTYTIVVTGGGAPADVGWELIGATSGQFVGSFGGAVGTFFFGINEDVVPGCTDVNASNYNPGATLDDGSCITCAPGEQILYFRMTDSFGDGWNGGIYVLADDQGNIINQGGLADGLTGVDLICLAAGCYSISVTEGAFPEEIFWTIENINGDVLMDGVANTTNFGFTWAGATGCVIPGCTNPDCNNYNSFATDDDGSCICPPENDACANATDIGCGQTVTGTTVNANVDPFATDCNAIPVTEPGVWYNFIGTGEQVTLSTCNSGAGDTRVSVYAGSCTNPVCVTANDDGCVGSNLSSITFSTVNGIAYYVLVHEFSFTANTGDGVDFTLEMSCTDCPAIPINDECLNALPLPEGVNFPGNLCCSNPDSETSPWDPFGTQYGIWYTINSGANTVIDIQFFNGNAQGPDAGDGGDIGIAFLVDDGGGCAALTPLVGGVGLTDGFVFNSFDFNVDILPNTDYYFLLTTSDPQTCGQFILNVNLGLLGCTDLSADNFNPLAIVDDGTCTYTNPPANDLCADAEVLDCNSTVNGSTGLATNTGAPNVCATVANGNGVWYSFVGTGEFVTLSTCGSQINTGISVVSSANGCAGPFTCVISENDDNTAQGCNIWDPNNAKVSFVSVVGTQYYVYITSDNADGAFTLETTCVPVVNGCLDACACNYNANANVDNSSCEFFSCAGCTATETAIHVTMTDDFGDGWTGGSYTITDAIGAEVATGVLDDACGDGLTVGSESICLADGCYTLVLGGGTFPADLAITLEDADGNIYVEGLQGTYGFVIGTGTCGCTDAGACNYDPTATLDDNSCEFLTCAGCTDNAACNYDPNATIPVPNSCCFDNCITLIMNDGFGDGWNGASVVITDAVTGNIVGTGTIIDGFTATATFCLADGCYVVNTSDGDFPTEVSWVMTGANGGIINGSPGSQNISTGSGNCVVGCTEPMACNYNPDAGLSDCTLCEYLTCQGCTYAQAENYNADATIDDGSCIITGGGSTCPADINDDGLVGVGDLIEFIGAFGTICPN